MIVPVAVCLVVLLAWWAGGVDPSGLLHLAPALVLGVALLARRYPGERMLVRLAGSARRAPRRRLRLASGMRRSAAALVPRGGLLMGRSLAVRPPPAAFLAN